MEKTKTVSRKSKGRDSQVPDGDVVSGRSREDAADVAAFGLRAKEPRVGFDQMIASLRRAGKLA